MTQLTKNIVLVHGGFVDGSGHGMPTTNADVSNSDLLVFIKGEMAATV
ncbi:MAG: hypothetical protein QOI77_3262 [Blastocatellia bacterium]|jgi:hypothetical protein|nr:hypothetical protein [Blastocatellia bacterium]